jgi:hypothetical protein
MPTLKLTVQVSEQESEQIKSWQVQGLVDSDDELLDSLILIRDKRKTQIAPTGQTVNLPQRVVLTLGILLVALMLLVPPYSYYARDGGEFSGYGFIFSPDKRFILSLDGVDLTTLTVQCLLVGVLTGGLVFLFHRRK